MTSLSSEQQAIVELPLEPLCVTACAGSGKTRTATHRLWQMRKLLEDRHGIVALLSFSNVAVDTFRQDYYLLGRTRASSSRSSAVEIDTVDGFLTTNVIRPHAHRAMGATRTPFLVHGREPFLKRFTVFDGNRPQPTADLRISLKGAAFAYQAGPNYAAVSIAPSEAEKGIVKLGKVGAYTHSSGRYWAIRTLQNQPFVLRALARRYPLILIDEAQDIGPEHQAILEMLVGRGVQLSLIGDKNQGIYDFSGATGAFLGEYGSRSDVKAQGLTVNYRSVPSIVGVANKLAGRSDTADRTAPACLNGAFFIPYLKAEKDKLLSAFQSTLDSAEVGHLDAVVVCRSSSWVDEWRGGEEAQGQGVIKAFVNATVCRDRLQQYDEAFRHTCVGVIGVLADEHGNLANIIARGSAGLDVQRLKRMIWTFARDPAIGLPAGSLLADTEWHPLLVGRLKALLPRFEADFALKPADNLGNKLSKKALLHKPIIQLADLASTGSTAFHVSTVHQVKGESIDGVMYVADKSQVRALLDGTGTEVGRIGYVAVTRARNLLVLAVPASCVGEFEPELLAAGFRRAGS
jgi:superfamily I DNA/RNA helicase